MPRVNTNEILRKFGDWRNIADIMTAGRNIGFDFDFDRKINDDDEKL